MEIKFKEEHLEEIINNYKLCQTYIDEVRGFIRKSRMASDEGYKGQAIVGNQDMIDVLISHIDLYKESLEHTEKYVIQVKNKSTEVDKTLSNLLEGK